MVSKPEVVVDGIAMPEGPVWCDDGTLVCTSVTDAKLWRIWPEQGRKEELCDTEGGANSAALASDGGFVITQNGGIDFHALQVAGDWAKPRYVVPGLQRMLPDRTVVRARAGHAGPQRSRRRTRRHRVLHRSLADAPAAGGALVARDGLRARWLVAHGCRWVRVLQRHRDRR